MRLPIIYIALAAATLLADVKATSLTEASKTLDPKYDDSATADAHNNSEELLIHEYCDL